MLGNIETLNVLGQNKPVDFLSALRPTLVVTDSRGFGVCRSTLSPGLRRNPRWLLGGGCVRRFGGGGRLGRGVNHDLASAGQTGIVIVVVFLRTRVGVVSTQKRHPNPSVVLTLFVWLG